jgi:arsenate reductase (thioredoxin)
VRKKPEPAMVDKPYNVLFLCTGNSARSIMGECILNREGAGKFRAYSAGSQPTGEVNPHTIDLLKKLNYATDGLRSKSWEEFAAPGAPTMDIMITVCDQAAQEVCPVWPGQPVSGHWGISDPAAVLGDDVGKQRAFADAYRMLHDRISKFVNLPVGSLDRLTLRKHLDEIGQSK